MTLFATTDPNMIPFIKARLSTALGEALRAAHEPDPQEPVQAEAWPCSHSGARWPRLCVSVHKGSGIEKVQTLQSASSGLKSHSARNQSQL